jgi:hypothetical protein
MENNIMNEIIHTVEFDGGLDYKDELQFDEHISKNFNQAIEYIKESRNITLKEVQLNRNLVNVKQL